MLHNCAVEAWKPVTLVHLLARSCHPDAYRFGQPSVLESHILCGLPFHPSLWGFGSLFSRPRLPQIAKARGL